MATFSPETTTDRVIVGVFDDYATAQQAARELANQGIAENNVQIQSNLRTGAAGYGGEEHSESHHEQGFMGWLRGIFGADDSSDQREHYAEAIRRGNAVLSANVAESQMETAVRILNQYGAVDIDRRASAWKQRGYTGYDANAPAYTSDEAARERAQYRDKEGGASIPVIEEELQVGKRTIQRGGVRVYSHVVEQPVEEEITLREEHARVERRPADRAMSDAEIGRLQDQTIEVAETVEEPVISKRARVREEVLVGKETTERTEKIRDSVRRTEVKVDRLEGSEEPNIARDDVRQDRKR